MSLVFTGKLVASFLMLCMFTLLYKENPLSRLVEHVMIGVASGYTFITNINFVMNTGVESVVTGGKPHYIIALLLGLLLFTNMSKKYSYLSRYGLALITGAGVALAISRVILTDIFRQLTATVEPLLTASTPIEYLEILLMIAITVSVFSYFLFTAKAMPKKLASIPKLGRYALMLSFGLAYGQTSTYRINMGIGRLDALLEPVIRNYTYMFVAVILVSVIYWDLRLRK